MFRETMELQMTHPKLGHIQTNFHKGNHDANSITLIFLNKLIVSHSLHHRPKQAFTEAKHE